MLHGVYTFLSDCINLPRYPTKIVIINLLNQIGTDYIFTALTLGMRTQCWEEHYTYKKTTQVIFKGFLG